MAQLSGSELRKQNFFAKPEGSTQFKNPVAFHVGGDLARRLGNAGPRGSHRPPAPGCAAGHSPQALSSVRRDTHRGPQAERLLPEPPVWRPRVRMRAPVGGLLAALAMLFGMAVAFAPKPRITWEHRDAPGTVRTRLPPHPPALRVSPPQGGRFVYAGSSSGVVQAPVAFCEKHATCKDCVLARDPYCAWNRATEACVALQPTDGPSRDLIQQMSGDTSACPDETKSFRQHFFKHGGTAELKCSQKSNLARVVWTFQNNALEPKGPKYSLVGRKNLLIFNLSEGDSGVYQCLSEERVRNRTALQVVAKHVLEVRVLPRTPAASTLPAARAEGDRTLLRVSTEPIPGPPAQTPAPPPPSPAPTGVSCRPKTVINTVPQVHSEKTMYLKSSDNRLLMFLFLLFFVLCLCLVSYNCYKGYLPSQCLKFRSAVLLGKKQPTADFSEFEQSVKETLVEQGSFSQQNGGQPRPALDTGYETEQDTMASRVPTDREDSQRLDDLPARDRPFDVKCELKYADSDADVDAD
ncbi:semaphorin-4D-like [Leptonychotes weddellii]|uniref:Semaphorin-4D-like n=1 Tax=Leptonychotes weddellii TaxID=9713 RepID=A0A7F8Q053_LEPWE|nr:semaphorin-4D-like [Leptonychotes weddellii]